MIKQILFIIFIALNISLYSQSDYSITEVLDSTTFHYIKDNEGDYIVDYRTKTGRTQNVIISSKINSFQGIYVRDIISVSKIYNNEPLPEKLTKVLLIDNYSEKYLGSWAIDSKEDIITILFVIKLPYNVDKKILEAAIIEAAEAADALEKALEGIEE